MIQNLGGASGPLGAAAVALLEAHQQKAAPADEFVLPAEGSKSSYQGTSKIWPIAIQCADLPEDSLHVLRHMFGSSAASAGEAMLMIGPLLGHPNVRSPQIYAHIAYDPAWWAAYRVTASTAAALLPK